MYHHTFSFKLIYNQTSIKMTRGKAIIEEVQKIIISLSRSGKSTYEIGNIVNLSEDSVLKKIL